MPADFTGLPGRSSFIFKVFYPEIEKYLLAHLFGFI